MSENRVTLSIYLYWRKDKVLSKERFENNENKFVLKVWSKIVAKV